MSKNPFQYIKDPKSLIEAQTNVNYWWFEGMGCPEGQIEANWNTFIREMKRSAERDLQKFLSSTK